MEEVPVGGVPTRLAQHVDAVEEGVLAALWVELDDLAAELRVEGARAGMEVLSRSPLGDREEDAGTSAIAGSPR